MTTLNGEWLAIARIFPGRLFHESRRSAVYPNRNRFRLERFVHLFLDIGWHEVGRPDDHSLLNWKNSTCKLLKGRT